MDSNSYRNKYIKYKKKYIKKKGKKGYSNQMCLNNVPFDTYQIYSIYNVSPYKDLLEDTKSKIFNTFITVDDIPYKLQYTEDIVRYRTNLHHGQRKLFLNELQFLTKYLKHHTEPAYVIYAGAAPCNHMNYLSTLFPNIKFILVDPSPFEIFFQNPEYTHLNSGNDIVVTIKFNPVADSLVQGRGIGQNRMETPS